MATIKLHDRVCMCTNCGFYPREKPGLGCPVCGERRTMTIGRTSALALGVQELAARDRKAAGRVAA